MALEVKLQAFEGPLDLLLHLIEKNKVDIYDIPIAEITEQYLDYVRTMEKEDMDVTSEFMLMAATLLDIKCRMLLPKEVDEEGEEIDPRAELVQQLLEHKEYKFKAMQLRDWADDAGDVVVRKKKLPREVLRYQPEVDVAELFSGVTIQKLQEIFEFVMQRAEDRIDPVRSKFGHVEKEVVSVSDKIGQVRRMARRQRRFSFRGLLEAQHSRMQIVVTFLAILELMRIGMVEIEQETSFGEIEITATDSFMSEEGESTLDEAEAALDVDYD